MARLINVAGVNASLMANVAFWQDSQALFLNGARAIFLASNLILGAGSTLQVANVLQFVPGSVIKGGTTITDDTLIVLAASSAAHPVTVAFGHYASLDFGADSSITGVPVFKGPSTFNNTVAFNNPVTFNNPATFNQPVTLDGDVTLEPTHTMTLAWGSTLVNAAATTRTAAEDRIGPNAISGERMANGPDGPWTIDTEAWDWVIIPPQSQANNVYMLSTPKNQDRAISLTVTASTSVLNNDLYIGWAGSPGPLARFTNDSSRPPGSVIFGWDCSAKVWRVRSSTTVTILGGAGSALEIPS